MKNFIKKILVDNPIIELDCTGNKCKVVEAIRQKLILPYLDIHIKNYDLLDPKNAFKEFKSAIKELRQHKVAIEYDKMSEIFFAHSNFTYERYFHINIGTNYFQSEEFKSYINRTVFVDTILGEFLQQFPNIFRFLVSPITTAIITADQCFTPVIFLFDSAKKTSDIGIIKNNKIAYIEPFDAKIPTNKFVHYHLEQSYEKFSNDILNLALIKNQPVYYSSQYYGNSCQNVFKKILTKIYQEKFAERFQEQKIFLQEVSIIQMITQSMKIKVPCIWAVNNEVPPDTLTWIPYSRMAKPFQLITQYNSEENFFIYKADECNYGINQKRMITNTFNICKNPISMIAAWQQALYRRGMIDENNFLTRFAKNMHKALIDTVLKDKIFVHFYLYYLGISSKSISQYKSVSELEFVNAVANRFYRILQKQEDQEKVEHEVDNFC